MQEQLEGFPVPTHETTDVGSTSSENAQLMAVGQQEITPQDPMVRAKELQRPIARYSQTLAQRAISHA